MRWWICKSARSDGESVNLHPVTRLHLTLVGRAKSSIVRYTTIFVRYISRRLMTALLVNELFYEKNDSWWLQFRGKCWSFLIRYSMFDLHFFCGALEQGLSAAGGSEEQIPKSNSTFDFNSTQHWYYDSSKIAKCTIFLICHLILT